MQRVVHVSVLANWIEAEDLERLGTYWFAYEHCGFLALFALYDGIWEGHWFGTGKARDALTACRESIKMFFKDSGAQAIHGLTPCKNKTGLKMARLLGFQPIGFKWNWNKEVCLLSVKEK